MAEDSGRLREACAPERTGRGDLRRSRGRDEVGTRSDGTKPDLPSRHCRKLGTRQDPTASAKCPSGALCRLSFWEPMLGLLLGAYAGCLSGDRGRVSARGPGRSSFRGQMESLRSGADEECPWGGRWRISSRRQMQDVRPGADVESPSGCRCHRSS